MNKTLKINGSTILPVHNIRTIKPINEEERARMAAKYGKPADDFADKNISIQFADKTSKTAELTLDEVRAQGIALVNAGADRYVPAANIKSAEPFTKDDAAKLKDSGDYKLTQTFRSRVETTAGSILSSATAQQIVERAAKALEAPGQGTKASAPKTPANV